MPDSSEPRIYRLASDRAAGPLRFRSDAGDCRRFLDIAGYEGPELPVAMTDPVVESLASTGSAPHGWRIDCAEGRFEFSALAVEVIEEQPSLYEPLHRRFSLSRTDRVAIRVLLWILRLPGGAGLLRRWHAHRH